jgi:hypothetical protein
VSSSGKKRRGEEEEGKGKRKPKSCALLSLSFFFLYSGKIIIISSLILVVVEAIGSGRQENYLSIYLSTREIKKKIYLSREGRKEGRSSGMDRDSYDD